MFIITDKAVSVVRCNLPATATIVQEAIHNQIAKLDSRSTHYEDFMSTE